MVRILKPVGVLGVMAIIGVAFVPVAGADHIPPEASCSLERRFFIAGGVGGGPGVPCHFMLSCAQAPPCDFQISVRATGIGIVGGMVDIYPPGPENDLVCPETLNECTISVVHQEPHEVHNDCMLLGRITAVNLKITCSGVWVPG